MKTQTEKKPEQQSAAPKIQQEQSTGGTAVIEDNRPTTVYQRKLRNTMNAHAAGNALPVQRKRNTTGLPDTLKSGIETLSGYAMDDVKVHYNSNKPAQLQAHAYAQGTDIHLASGQEKHLPHEAWHVVQQKQGRVKPTMQLKGKVNVNDDTGLEKEADVMGERAISHPKGHDGIGRSWVTHTDMVVQRNEDDEKTVIIRGNKNAGYDDARAAIEGKDMSNEGSFEPVTGGGVTKRVYKWLGGPWMVCAHRERDKLFGELEFLITYHKAGLPVADIGDHSAGADGLLFPIHIPDFGNTKDRAPNGWAFLEREIAGVGIKKKAKWTTNMNDIDNFMKDVIAKIGEEKDDLRRSALRQTAYQDLQTIYDYVESTSLIPDLEFRYEEASGHIVVFDPDGDGANVPAKNTQFTWLDKCMQALYDEEVREKGRNSVTGWKKAKKLW